MNGGISAFGIVFGEQVDLVFPSSGESMSADFGYLLFLLSSVDLEILVGFELKSNGCSSDGVLEDFGVAVLVLRFLL